MHRKNNETVLACVPFMLMFNTVPYKNYSLLKNALSKLISKKERSPTCSWGNLSSSARK